MTSASQSRPSGRGQDSRARASGAGARAAARRAPVSRTGTRPAARPGNARSRKQAAGLQAPARPRLTGRAAVLVLVLAVLTVSYASSMRAYLEQRRQIDGLKKNIATSQAAIASLQREKRRWQDPAYQRAMVHQRLGWVLPGEIGFRVIRDNGKPLGQHDSLSDPTSVTRANRPLWWQSAWGSVVTAGKPEVAPGDVPQPVTRIRVPKGSAPTRNGR